MSIKKPNITVLAQKTVCDTKITETENKIPSATSYIKKLIMVQKL